MISREKIVFTVFCSLFLFVFGDDGLCGIEPPKDGKSCSGSDTGSSISATTKKIEDTIYEKLVFEDYPENETETWAKRFYTKISYTSKYDWPIRHLLDDAEDHIANDAQAAIDKLNAILQKYPDSPRAQYDLIRAIQYRFYERERDEKISEEQKTEHTLDLIQKFVEIITQYRPLDESANEVSEDEVEDEVEEVDVVEYVLPPAIFNSAVQQALMECDNANLTELCADITERIFEINPQFAAQERYHILLIEKYYVMDDTVAMETAVERARARFPESTLIKFFYGLLLKMTDRKKEGNKLLREIEYEGDAAVQFADEMRQLGRNLYNRGKVRQAHELFRETSKTHGFMSLFQRPIMSIPDLEAAPVWNAEEQVSLTKHDEEFQVLTEKYNDIKQDLFKASSNMSEGWLSHIKTSHDQNLIVGQGNWSVYPLFAWGKRKSFSCSKVPQTCLMIKEKFPLAAQFGLGVARFEALFGKTGVIPHCGPVNSRLRMILPLQVPKDSNLFKYRISKDTKVPFEEGKIVVVDDSFEHEMINDSDEPTFWLSIDFPHPDMQFGAEKKTGLTTYAKRHFIAI